MSSDISSSGLSALNVGQINHTKDVPWFHKSINLKLVNPAFVELLETYADIPPEAQEKHLYEVRDLAWATFPMPCIGLWWWLKLGLSTHPQYPELLARFQAHSSASPVKFLDLGTCLGQDVRKLIHDGAPVECVYSSDIFAGYEAVGHALFRDVEKMRGHFIHADIFDNAPDAPLVKTRGTWDVVSIMLFLHAFKWDDQVAICKSILKLLKPQPGSMVIGLQHANTKSGEEQIIRQYQQERPDKYVFTHNKETFKQMWEEIAESEGLDLKILVDYMPGYKGKGSDGSRAANTHPFFPGTGGENKRLFFSVERL